MIEVIIVEDDDLKSDRVKSKIEDAALNEGANIKVVKSVYEAGVEIGKKKFDLMILDVCLPLRDREDPREDGAELLLRQIQTKHAINVPAYIVGLTAFSEISAKYQEQFNQFGWLLISYDSGSNAWAVNLTNTVSHISKNKQVVGDLS